MRRTIPSSALERTFGGHSGDAAILPRHRIGEALRSEGAMGVN
jgi:hypothetical protein